MKTSMKAFAKPEPKEKTLVFSEHSGVWLKLNDRLKTKDWPVGSVCDGMKGYPEFYGEVVVYNE